MLTVALLLLHGLCALALLGAVTHQAVAVRPKAAQAGTGRRGGDGFLARYGAVGGRGFVGAVIVLYMVTFAFGAVIYPAYRIDVRPSFEDMDMVWAVGLFEVKEHWAAIGLFALPFYARVWADARAGGGSGRAVRMVTWLLAGLVWFDLVAGHLLNNLRGL